MPDRSKQLSPEQQQLLEVLRREKRQRQQSAALERIPPRASQGPAPLSFAQQRLWVLHQLMSDDSAHTLAFSFTIAGALDVPALERSFEALVQHHESLRTVFPMVDGQPVQLVLPRGAPLRRVDLRGLALAEREAAVRGYEAAEAAHQFDLAAGPLMRLTLLALGDGEHRLLVTLHHIITDGWSMGVLTRDLYALYTALAGGRPAELPPLPIQYADYAVWQRQWLQGAVLERQLAYWRAKLAGAPEVLALPLDRPRPAAGSFGKGNQPLALSPQVSAALRALTQRAGCTLFMTLLAGIKLVLMHYSQQDDIVIGTPIAGRTRAELDRLIGFFVNTLVLRTDLSGDPTAAELLQRVRQTALDAYAHQDVPFHTLVDTLVGQRDLSHPPLVQVLFVYGNSDPPALALDGVQISTTHLPSAGTTFDLTVALDDRGGQIDGWLDYNTDLFDAATVARMARHLEHMLAAMAEAPERRISALPILTPDERRLMLEGWNTTADAPRNQLCLHQLVEAQVERSPGAVALADGAYRLTYHELNQHANALAARLRDLGVGPDTCVGLCMERSAEAVVAVLAILKAGGAYVPIEPELPRERIAFMLADARAVALVSHTPALPNLPALAIPVVAFDRPGAPPEPALPNPASGVGLDHLAYVIYTSGSTGQPKGVLVPHRGAANFVTSRQRRIPLRPDDRILQTYIISFDPAVWQIFCTLSSGARLVVARPGGHQDSAYLAGAIVEEQISVLGTVPAMLPLLLAEPVLAAQHRLRLIFCGGEGLPSDLYERATAQLGARLHNAYGPTETSVDATIWAGAIPPGQPVAPLGRPIDHVQVYLLDPHMRPVPVGVPGELYIGGAGVARGYLGRPDLTAERFLPNPFGDQRRRTKDEFGAVESTSPSFGDRESSAEGRIEVQDGTPSSFVLRPSSGRLYKTGDMARWLPDGTLVFLGRSDHQVKVRGYRVELGEIEMTLDRHPAVSKSVVLAREDSPGVKRLVAYVVPADEQPTTNDQGNLVSSDVVRDRAAPELGPKETTGDGVPALVVRPSSLVGELRAHLAGRLPDYMVPAAFVVLEQLPLAANGKIDQRRLPVPEYTRESADAPFVAPRTAAEARLAQIWQEVLRIAQIGVHDNFFALGGDSMLSIQIVARAKEVGLQLTPKQIFQHQTVAALAQLAQGAGVAAEQGIVSGPIPLTPGQHIYFSVPQENHHYSNIAILLEIDQPPVLPLLRQAVAHLAAHHDGLRARFTQTGAGWQAHILPPEEQAIPVVAVDLAGLPAEEQRAAIEAAVAEFQRSLHLTRGPVGRVAHFDLGPGRPGRLLLLFHHLLLDTISLTPLQQDLMTAYQQLAQGQPVKLPPKTTSVRYWAERLVRYAQSEQARAEAAYWLAQPWERIAPLPADFPESRGLNIQGSLQSVTASLSAAETRVLTEHLHEAHGAQMLDAILVALGQAFAPWLEADTLLVEVLVHGRHTLFDDVDLSRTLNWTGNFVPIFVDTGAADTAAALERVVAYRSGLPPESCSFGAIKTLSQDPAIRARAQSLPRADVMLNYHGVLSQQGDDEAGAPFRKAAESVSACIDPRNVRPEAFWCQGGIIGGCLSIDFMYSTNMYRRGSVEPVAERFRAALQRLALSCQGYATKESYV